MATPNAVEYHVFVDSSEFTKLGITQVGTIDEYRGGVQYVGRLLAPPELGMNFGPGTGMQRATEVTLRIADGPTGIYRDQAANGSLRGTTAKVTVVMRETTPEGVASEITESQTLTITGIGLTRSEVILRCTDIENTKLDSLYPPLTWEPGDWPQLRDSDAGRPVCLPIGTALKFPCPQLVADATNAQFFFGVCAGTPKLLTITGINSFTKRVTVSAAYDDLIEVGQVVYITGSSAADGRYTVAGLVSATVFQVTETLPASTGGSVRLMPHVRTLYRAGRVIDPSEYQIVHVAKQGPVINGDFASGTLAGWTVTTLGSGTVSAATFAAVCTVTGVSTIARIDQAIATSKDLWHGLSFDASGTLPTRIFGTSVDMVRDVQPGARRAALVRSTATGANSIGLGAVAATGNATIDNIELWNHDMVVALFDRPQVDFQGNTYAIEADVRGVESRNAASEVNRLLSELGLTLNFGSLAAAVSTATSERMLVDCDYGRGGKRSMRAILEDHLYLLRGALYRDAAGAYAIAQDKAGVSSASLDEDAGDSLDVESVDWGSNPSSVSLRYRPGSRDPGELQQEIERAVVGGSLGDENPRDMPYLRDHEAADRLLCYVAKRAAASGRCRATVYRHQFQLSEIVTLGSQLNWGATARQWIVRGVSRTPNANALDLTEYSASVYTYVPAAHLPTDAEALDYQPDYSQTPPAAPTALTITAADVALAPDGSSSAWVTARCTPPAVNWAQVWFTAIHNVTGEVSIGQGTSVGGGNYGTTLAGLRAGNVYQLKAYAVNAFNVQGALQGTFDATAIGGAGAATTFVTPGYATLPPNVASCTASQGTGLIIQVKWPAVSLPADVLGDYILERRIGAAAYAEVWRGRANSYTDRDFTQYGVAAQYRVKASDRWGNVSAAYATSGAVTLNRNIAGGTGSFADILDNTVGTVNRTAVSTISTAFSNPSPQLTFSVSHSLGKVPLVTADTGTTPSLDVWVGLTNVTTTQIFYNVNRHTKDGLNTATSNNSVAGDPHTHNLTYTWTPVTGAAVMRIW